MRSFLGVTRTAAAMALLLVFSAIDARAGTVGVEQFNLANNTSHNLIWLEDHLYGFSCWCGPFDGNYSPPPQIVPPYGPPDYANPEWFVGVTLEGANLAWYVTYGVQSGDTQYFSQYCTVSADTSTYSNRTENEMGFCFGTPGEDCPTCDVITFQDYYDAYGGEGGQFTLSEPSLAAAVPEPTSAAALGLGVISLIGLGWLRRLRQGVEGPPLP
jgi:hypothetical protein